MMNQQIDTGSLPSRPETCITAQKANNQKDDGSKAGSLPDSTGIMKTSDFSSKNFRKVEGKWISEHSSLSDRERGVDDIV